MIETKCHFVTGCAGFIGSKVAKLLLEKGYRVIGVDNLNDYYDVALKYYRLDELNNYSGFKFYKINIENLDSIKELFEKHKPDAVLNLAARAGVRHSLVDPHVYLRTNTAGTLNLLEVMRNYHVRKLVLASTSSLYAGQKLPFNESLPVNTPISPYAASKKAAEVMAYSYHHIYKIDVSVVRYFTVYGPAGRPDMSIFRFVKWIDEGTPITIYGDGSQSRDFTYVDDIAEGTYAAIRNVGYEVINLGGGDKPVSLTNVIKILENYMGKKANIIYKSFHQADIEVTQADIQKANRILNWRPTVKLEAGLRKTVDWHRSNMDLVSNMEIN